MLLLLLWLFWDMALHFHHTCPELTMYTRLSLNLQRSSFLCLQHAEISIVCHNSPRQNLICKLPCRAAVYSFSLDETASQYLPETELSAPIWTPFVLKVRISLLTFSSEEIARSPPKQYFSWQEECHLVSTRLAWKPRSPHMFFTNIVRIGEYLWTRNINPILVCPVLIPSTQYWWHFFTKFDKDYRVEHPLNHRAC